MKPLEEIRRENLGTLVEAEGSQAAFARHIGKDKNQVNQWLGRAGKRNISAETCREIEARLGRPNGWMDHDHSRAEASNESHPAGLDAKMMREAILWLQDQFRAWRRDFDAADRTDMILAVYSAMREPVEPNWIALSQQFADQLEAKGGKRESAVGGVGADDRVGNSGRAGKAKVAARGAR